MLTQRRGEKRRGKIFFFGAVEGGVIEITRDGLK